MHSGRRKRAFQFMGGGTHGIDFFLGRALVLLAGVGLGCTQKQVEPSESTIEVRVKTQLGKPLEGIMVRAGRHLSITDDQGLSEFSVSGGKGVVVQARCPSDMQGAALRREFSPAILARGAHFATELVCHEPPPMRTFAIFVEGCGDVEVFLDEVSLGMTQNGWLHEERSSAGPQQARLRIEPIEDDCRIDGGSVRRLEFSETRAGAWVHFRGARPSQRHRSSNAKRKGESPRPYRL